MSEEFEMSMVGDLNYFLGLQIKQLDNEIFISQSKYARNLVKKFGLENTKHIRTPMGTNDRLSKDDVGTSLYKSMIGSLLYLTASRPDICFSVGVCARYQSDPKESHLKAVKRIIRYRGKSSGARAKREKPSSAAADTSLAPKIPMELVVDAVPLAIEYPPLEITSAPHKEAPIAEEEQVTKPVQGSSSFHTPKTSLANTAEVVETLRDFNQGQMTDPIGEEAHPVPNSVPQPTAHLSTSSDSVEFTVQQGSTSDVPVRSPVRTRGRTTQIPEEFNPQGNIHVSVSDNSSEESAQGDDMDVEGDRIEVSKAVSHKFYFDYAKEMWECVSQRILWFERSIRLSDLEDRGLDSILIDRQLICYVTDIKPYVPQVVKEFYCNLRSNIIKADSGKFGNVYVRALTNWTPTANHTVFVKDQAILLYCIGTRHPYDLDRHIMRTIAKHAGVKTTTGYLPFPSLIYNVLVSQGFKKLRNEQLKYPRESIAVVGATEIGTSGAGGVHAEPRVAAAAEIGGEALDVDTQQAGEGQAEADKEA
ncbi:hypothetical protein Pfo_003499 [Paulownia fortunei]|nr:hypothetical protein Pfo_003499 [Paulownia fortunei]